MPDAGANAPLEIDTRFGKCAALAADVVIMPEGMPGFERCRRFVLASSPDIAPFTCVHGLDEPRPSFLAIDPHLVVDGYASPLDTVQRQRIDVSGDEPLLWLSLVHTDGDRATVNLRAPLVINPRRMLGLQVVAAQSAYPLDHPLPID
jgi:flagellar assembly factor FliW